MCEYCFMFLSCKYTTKFVQVERKASKFILKDLPRRRQSYQKFVQVERKASKFILKGINLLPYFVAR